MPLPEKSPAQVCFIDYIPAELRENKRWLVVYYARCPYEKKLKRKEMRVRPIKSITERRKLGKRMVSEVNKKLESGWNPFYGSNIGDNFKNFFLACDDWVKTIEFKVYKKELRKDTLKSYKSLTNNLKVYAQKNKGSEMLCIHFNKEFIDKFLDHIYYERQNSAKTRNNYLVNLKTLSKWLLNKNYIPSDPTFKISRITEKKKKRTIIPANYLKSIFEYLEEKHSDYYILCLVAYYCLIRRTEMTKIKVRDIILFNSILYVEGENSKNKKSQSVTIPDKLLPIIANHIANAKQNDYLFAHNFKPGPKQMGVKKINNYWNKLRKDLKLPNEYQWYSLKDTGITNLLLAGVPILTVRDQARHSDIKQTDAYTPKEIFKANTDIKTVNIID